MDYTKTSLKFKIIKSLRYLRLYGLSRTLIKIAGQYHMKAEESTAEVDWQNPAVSDVASKHVAIIGCGNFAFANIAYYLDKNKKGVILGTYDKHMSRAVSLAKKYKAAFAFKDAASIVNHPGVKLVYVASNHASHAEYAIDCIKTGKDVHIEKPVVVSYDQLERLTQTIRNKPDAKVFLGFNRPKSKLFFELTGHLKKESGPLMVNWFIAGHEIADDHWYFDEKEGGRILGNLCHWSDLTLELIGYDNAFPCVIKSSSPSNSKSDFVVSIEFKDKSCATLTFSAKGHSFEGVREILNIHKGNLIGNLQDFQSIKLDIIDKRITHKLMFRDHGHQQNIMNSYNASTFNINPGVSLQYLIATSLLALKIKESVDNRSDVTLTQEEIDNLCRL